MSWFHLLYRAVYLYLLARKSANKRCEIGHIYLESSLVDQITCNWLDIRLNQNMRVTMNNADECKQCDK